MKKYITLTTIVLLLSIILSACTVMTTTVQTTETDEINNCPHYPFYCYETVAAQVFASAVYATFEQQMELSTDVVVAQFIARRRFNQYTIELEFAVSDRILGNAPDTIFIYIGIATVHFDANIPSRLSTDISFEYNVNYMLFLQRITDMQTSMQENGYGLLHIQINMDDPTQSTMFNVPLVDYTTSAIPIDFASRSTTSDTISDFVAEATKNNQTHYNDIFFHPVLARKISSMARLMCLLFK